MPINYEVRVYDTGGVLQAVITDYRSLVIEHRVNTPSTLTLGMYTFSPNVQYFGLDSLVEVRRQYPDAGLDWYTEFIGFHRTPQRQITSADSRIYTSYARGLLDLVRRRSIRYYADTDGSAKGPAPADDVIKDYVRENCGSLATTANRRVTDGVIPGFTVQANLSLAPSFEGADAWRNVLEAITDIGEPNKVDFDVVWLRPNGWEFRTYYPQLGTDRRIGTADPMLFSVYQGNMTNISYTVSRTDEVTSALVLGPGEGPLRDTTLVTSARQTDSPYNLIEGEYNASGEDREAALIAGGQKLLYEKRAAVNVTFDPIQTRLSAYHKHYFLGDLVNTTVLTSPTTQVDIGVKIRAITLSVGEGGETITLELEEPSTEVTTSVFLPGTG